VKFKETLDKILVDDQKSIYKTFGTETDEEGNETPIYVNPKTGATEIDPDKLRNLALANTVDLNFFDEAVFADVNNDELWATFNDKMAAASYGWYLGSSGISKEDAQDLLEGREDANEILSLMDSFEEAERDSQTSDDIRGEQVDKKFKRFLHRINYFLNARGKMLDEMYSKNPEVIGPMVEDNQAALQKVTNASSRKALKSEFVEAVGGIDTLNREVKELETEFEAVKKTDPAKADEIARKISTKNYLMSERMHVDGYDANLQGIDAENNKALVDEYFRSKHNNPTTLGMNPSMAVSYQSLRDRKYYRLGKAYMAAKDINDIADEFLEERDIDDLSVGIEALRGSAKYFNGENSDVTAATEKINTALDEEIDKINIGLQEVNEAMYNLAGENLGAEETKLVATHLKDTQSQLQTQMGRIKLLREEMSSAHEAINATDDEYAAWNTEDGLKMEHFRNLTKKIWALDSLALESFDNLAKTMQFMQLLLGIEAAFEDRTDISDDLKADVAAEILQLKEILKAYREAAEKNMQSRASKQVRALRELGQVMNEATLKLEAPRQLLLDVFGNDAIREFEKQFGDEPSFEQFEVLMSLFSERASDGQKQKMREALLRTGQSTVSALSTLSKGLADPMNPTDRGSKILTNYLANPIKYASAIVMPLLGGGLFTPENTIFWEYRENKDIAEFKHQLESISYAGLSVDKASKLKAFFDAHTLMRGLQLAGEFLSAEKANTARILEEEVKLHKVLSKDKAPEDVIAPTPQQYVAYQEAIRFLFKPLASKWASNTFYLEGFPGSGKTKVAARRIVDLWKSLEHITDSQIYTAGNTVASSKIIHEAVKGTEGGATTIEDLLAADLTNTKLVIIDEAPALERSVALALTKKLNAAKVKTIILGDPAQVTVDAHPFLLNEKYIRITMSDPLTASYRTNIPAIYDFFINFKNTSAVHRQLAATSNMSLGDVIKPHSNALGVVGDTERSTMLRAIARPSSRSKLLIVANKDQKQRYLNEYFKDPEYNISDVEVLTYDQANGIQADEVYIDMPTTALDIKGNNFKPIGYNKAMYTAASRPVKFLFVLGSLVQTQVDSMLDSTVQTAASELLQNVEQYEGILTAKGNAHAALTNEAVDGTLFDDIDEVFDAAKTTDKETTDDDIEIARQERGSPDQELPEEPEDVGAIEKEDLTEEPVEPTKLPRVTSEVIEYDFKFPQNSNIKVDNLVATGSQFKIVAAVSRSPKKFPVAHYVVAPTIGDPNRYVVVAMLGNDDYQSGEMGMWLKREENKFKADPNRGPVESSTRIRMDEDGFDWGPDLDRAVIGEGTLSNVQKLQYVYDRSAETSMESDIHKYLDTFFPNDDTYRTGKKLNWAALNPYIKYKIFTSDFGPDAASKVPKGQFVPRPGVPYAVLQLPMPNSEKKHSPQYIRQQRRKVRMDHPYIKTLRELYDNIIILEAGLGLEYGTEEFNKLIKANATRFELGPKENGFPVKLQDNPAMPKELEDLTAEQINALDSLVKLLYGAEYSRVVVETKAEANAFTKSGDGRFYIDKEYTGNGYAFMERVAEDSSIAQPEPYRQWQMRGGVGEASTAFNAIAVANGKIEGLNIKVKKRKKTSIGTVEFYVGKSLLAFTENTRRFMAAMRGRYEDTRKEASDFLGEALPEKFPRDWETAMKVLAKVYDDSNGLYGVDRADIMRAQKELIAKPVTTDLLAQIVTPTSERHPSLELPIYRKSFGHDKTNTGFNDLGSNLNNKDNRARIAEQVHGNLSRVIPTVVTGRIKNTVTVTEQQVPVKAPKKVKTQSQFNKLTVDQQYSKIVGLHKQGRVDDEVLQWAAEAKEDNDKTSLEKIWELGNMTDTMRSISTDTTHVSKEEATKILGRLDLEHRTYELSELVDKLTQFMSPFHRKLMWALTHAIDSLSKSGITVDLAHVAKGDYAHALGLRFPDGRIGLYTGRIFQTTKKYTGFKLGRVLAHELIHAITSDKLYRFETAEEEFTGREREILQQLFDIFTYVKSLKGVRGDMDNLREFVAEVFASERLARDLSRIELPPELRYKTNSRGILDTVKNLITNLLRIVMKPFLRTRSATEAVINLAGELIDMQHRAGVYDDPKKGHHALSLDDPDGFQYIKTNFGGVEGYRIAKNFILERLAYYKMTDDDSGREKSVGYFIPVDDAGFVASKEEIYYQIHSDINSHIAFNRMLAKNLVRDIAMDEAAIESATNVRQERLAKIAKEISEAKLKRVQDAIPAFETLMRNNRVTHRPVYFEVMKTIFPNWSIGKETQLDKYRYDTNENLIREMMSVEGVNLKEQIIDNEYQNNVHKLSDSVKDFLSIVQYTTSDNKIVTVNPSYAYVRALQLFRKLDFNTIVDLQDFEDRRKEIEKTEIINDATTSILDKLADLLQDATYTYNMPKYVNVIIHRPIGALTDEYYLILSNTEEVTNVVLLEEAKEIAKNDPDFRIVKSSSYILRDLYEEANMPITPKQFNKLYDRALARNTLAELHTLFSSQKETELMIASKGLDKNGKKKIRYIKAKDLGVNVSVRRHIADELTELNEDLKSKGGLKNFWNSRVGIEMDGLLTGNRQEKLKGIYKFYSMMGLGHLIREHNVKYAVRSIDGTAKTIIELMTDISNTLADTRKTKLLVDGEPQVDDRGKTIYTKTSRTMEDALANNNGRILRLSNIVSRNTELARATSVRDGAGKTLYKYNNSHYLYDLFDAMISKRRDKHEFRDKGLPQFLKSEYFSHNIFVNGLNSLHTNLLYHDVFRNENVGSTKVYGKETAKHRAIREFVAGFVATLDASGKARRYNQFFYPPSDRSKVFSAEVSALTPDEIKEGLLKIIQQFKARPVVGHVKNYNRKAYTNLRLLESAVQELGGDISSISEKKLVNKMFDKLGEEAVKAAKEFIANEVDIPGDFHKVMSDLRKGKKFIVDVKSAFKFHDKEFAGSSPIQDYKKLPDGSRAYDVKVEQILPLVDAFVKNNYVNGFFLNQLAVGDSAYYKQWEDDIVKRMAGPTASGQIGLVHPDFGMRENYKVLVLGDAELTPENIRKFLERFLKPEDVEEVIEAFSKGNIDWTDAQGFITPRRAQELRKGFGRAYKVGRVVKPVHFEIRTDWVPLMNFGEESAASALMNPALQKQLEGKNFRISPVDPTVIEEGIPIPTYTKYSAVELSDDLADIDTGRFKRSLGIIRQRMEELGVDEVIFGSGIKVGAPKNTIDVEAFVRGDKVEQNNILTLSNRDMRLQLNPWHDPDSHVSIYTQLMYFIGILGENDADAGAVYDSLASVIKEGTDLADETLDDGSGFRAAVMSALEGRGNERALQLVESGLSFDNPILQKKALVALVNMIEKLTIRVKFPGGKMVLQSAYGIQKYGVKKLESGAKHRGEELTYGEDENGRLYAEVIMPKSVLTKKQIDAINKGKPLFAFHDAFGFRIPSTELHSAVPLKIVGTYDDYGTNVIIAPKELVPLHGSDFDVDSLFIVWRDSAKNNVEVLNTDKPLKAQDVIDGKFTNRTLVAEGDYIGYAGGELDPEFLPKLDRIEEELKSLRTRWARINNEPKEYARLRARISKDLRKVRELRIKYHKNVITEHMLKIMTDPKNRKRMLTPISTEEFGNTLDELGLGGKEHLDLNLYTDKSKAFNLVRDGQQLVGIFANNIKSLAYMVRAGSTVDRPVTKEKTHFDYTTIDGVTRTFDRIREYDVTDPTKQMWQRLDAMVNAAIDNIKELKLPRASINVENGNTFSALLGLGMPIRDAVMLFNQPVTLELNKAKYSDPVMARSVLAKAIALEKKSRGIEEAEPITPSADILENYLSEDLDIEGMSNEELLQQEAILDIFKKASMLGENLRGMSSFLSIVRQYPVDAAGIDAVTDDFNEIFGEYEDAKAPIDIRGGFYYDIPNFFKVNPHIAATYEGYLMIRKYMDTQFAVHSQEFRDFAKDMKNLKIKLNRGWEDSSSAANKALIREELVKYLMADILVDKVVDTEPFLIFGFKDRARTLFGSSAFSHRFVKKVQAAKKADYLRARKDSSYKPNSFLFHLSVDRNFWTGMLSLRFSKGSNLTIDEVEELEQDFISLKNLLFEEGKRNYSAEYTNDLSLIPQGYSEFQLEFVDYAVLNYGLGYSSANYSNILPTSIYKELDADIKQRLEHFRRSEDLRADIKEHFEVSLATMYADKLPYVPSRIKASKQGVTQFTNKEGVSESEPLYSGKKIIDGNPVHFDRLYEKVSKDDASYMSSYIKSGMGDRAEAFIKVYTSEDGHSHAYQRTGVMLDKSYEVYESIDEPYLIMDYFSPRQRTIKVQDINEDKIDTHHNMAGYEGEEIHLVTNSDVTRVNRRTVVVQKATQHKGGGTTLEVTTALPDPFVESETDLDAFDMEIPHTEESGPGIPDAFTANRNETLRADIEAWSAAARLNETEERYEISGNNYGRVSNVLNAFRDIEPGAKWFEKQAQNRFKGYPEGTKLHTEEGTMTEEEYLEALKVKDVKGRTRGKIIHNIIQTFIKEFYNEDATELYAERARLLNEGNYQPWEFNWLIKLVPSIIKRSGINVFDKILAEENRDHVMSEVVVASDILDIAGTIDMLIQHGDGTYSIVDFKTGIAFGAESPHKLKYYNGINSDIHTSPRDMAKLQIALYAFIMKAQHPEIKFRNLEVSWIPSANFSTMVDHKRHVDMEDYLHIIKQWLQRDPKMAETWVKIQNLDHFKQLFDPTTYNASYSKSISEDLSEDGKTPEQLIQIKTQRLKELTLYKVDEETPDDDVARAKKVEAIKLVQELVELKGDKNTNYDGWKADIGELSTYLGNINDINHPYIRLYGTEFEKAKQRADKRFDTYYKGFLARMRPVYKSYQKRKKIPTPWEKLPFIKGSLNLNKYTDIFEPALKQKKQGDVSIPSFNNTDADWSAAQTKYRLSDKEISEYKALVKYLQDSYEGFFVDSKSKYGTAVWNQVATTRKIKGVEEFVTNGELFNGMKGGDKFSVNARTSPFKYSRETFMPMIYRSAWEIVEKEGAASKEHRDHLYHKYLKMFYEDTFDQWYNSEEALPLKYLPNDYVLASGNYSINLEQQFDLFMRSMIYKEELDDVYAFGKGLQYLFDPQIEDSKAWKRAKHFMKLNIEMQLKGRRQKDIQLFGRRRKDIIKMGRTFKQGAAAPIMWLKPITGTVNGIFAFMVNIKEAMKGSIIKDAAKLFPGLKLNTDIADFTVSDLAWSIKEYFKMQFAAATGGLKRNKMFLMAKKLQYLPDNYKWASDSSHLLTTKNKFFSQRTLYMFHTIPEEAVAFMVMGAQLRNMKVSKDHKTHAGTSLWNMYDVVKKANDDGTEYHDVQWKRHKDGPDKGRPVVRGKINLSKDEAKERWEDVTELSSLEAQRLKYVYQRMHGGYREDERITLEYYLLGELFIQYRKFLPTILKNGMMSKGKLDSLGHYVTTGKKDGVETMEWTAEVMEGRWLVVTKMLLAALGIKGKFDNPSNAYQRVMNRVLPHKREDYMWRNLEPRQKEAMIDFAVTMAT